MPKTLTTQDKAIIYLSGILGEAFGAGVASSLDHAAKQMAAKGDSDLSCLLDEMARMAKHSADLRSAPPYDQ